MLTHWLKYFGENIFFHTQHKTKPVLRQRSHTLTLMSSGGCQLAFTIDPLGWREREKNFSYLYADVAFSHMESLFLFCSYSSAEFPNFFCDLSLPSSFLPSFLPSVFFSSLLCPFFLPWCAPKFGFWFTNVWYLHLQTGTLPGKRTGFCPDNLFCCPSQKALPTQNQ